MKKGKIDVYEGIGCILGFFIFFFMLGIIFVELKSGEENEMFILKNVIVVIGFCFRILFGLMIDGEKVIILDEVLKMEIFFVFIIIVGGGVIGIEWVLMFIDFDVDVMVVEYSDWILLIED